MMAAHSSLDDVRNWPIFPRLSPVGLAYGLGKVATNDRISRSTSSCFDANMYTFAPTRSTPSPHAVRFVTVEKGVRLEALDWGGSGSPVVLLAGGGNTAHVFDEFAPKLTSDHHVYGINRDHLNMMRCWVDWLRRLQKQRGKAENLSHCDD